MADQPEARIITSRRPDGSSEIFVLDPKTGREARTGLSGTNDRDTEQKVRQVAETMKRGGNRVTLHESR